MVRSLDFASNKRNKCGTHHRQIKNINVLALAIKPKLYYTIQNASIKWCEVLST